MRMLTVIATVLFGLIPATATARDVRAHAASGKVWICHEAGAPPCDGYYSVKPASISFDIRAELAAVDLKWTHWGKATSTATGKSLSRTYFKQYPMKLTATKLGSCPGGRAYKQLSVKFRGKTTLYKGCSLTVSH